MIRCILRRLPVLCLLAALLPAAPASASESVTFRVANERGTSQFSYVEAPGAFSFNQQTTADGRITLTVNPGDTVRFSRDGGGAPLGSPSSCAAPEDPAGVSYTVIDSTPSDVTVTVPNAGDTHLFGETAQERWMVGYLNRERAAHGLSPLEMSDTLTSAADEAAHATVQQGSFPPPHCAVQTIDTGWPTPDFTFEDAPGSDPHAALRHWDGSEGTAESQQLAKVGLLDPANTAVGIGDGNGWFIIEYNACPTSPAAAVGRCGMTGDDGLSDTATPTEQAALTIHGHPQPLKPYVQPGDELHVPLGANVSLTHTCADDPDGSGVWQCQMLVGYPAGRVPPVDGNPSTVTVDTSRAGDQDFGGRVTDNFGNIWINHYVIHVDSPDAFSAHISLEWYVTDGSKGTTDAAGAPHFGQGASVQGDVGCSLPHGGAIGDCTPGPVTRPDGRQETFRPYLDTSLPGTYTVVIQVTSSTGQVVTGTVHYAVDPPPAARTLASDASSNRTPASSTTDTLLAGRLASDLTASGPQVGDVEVVGLIGNCGGCLISDQGSGLISDQGAGLIPNAGGALFGRGGSNLVGAGGARLIGNCGGCLISDQGSGLTFSPALGVAADMAQVRHPKLRIAALGGGDHVFNQRGRAHVRVTFGLRGRALLARYNRQVRQARRHHLRPKPLELAVVTVVIPRTLHGRAFYRIRTLTLRG